MAEPAAKRQCQAAPASLYDICLVGVCVLAESKAMERVYVRINDATLREVVAFKNTCVGPASERTLDGSGAAILATYLPEKCRWPSDLMLHAIQTIATQKPVSMLTFLRSAVHTSGYAQSTLLKGRNGPLDLEVLAAALDRAVVRTEGHIEGASVATFVFSGWRETARPSKLIKKKITRISENNVYVIQRVNEACFDITHAAIEAVGFVQISGACHLPCATDTYAERMRKVLINRKIVLPIRRLTHYINGAHFSHEFGLEICGPQRDLKWMRLAFDVIAASPKASQGDREFVERLRSRLEGEPETRWIEDTIPMFRAWLSSSQFDPSIYMPPQRCIADLLIMHGIDVDHNLRRYITRCFAVYRGGQIWPAVLAIPYTTEISTMPSLADVVKRTFDGEVLIPDFYVDQGDKKGTFNKSKWCIESYEAFKQLATVFGSISVDEAELRERFQAQGGIPLPAGLDDDDDDEDEL